MTARANAWPTVVVAAVIGLVLSSGSLAYADDIRSHEWFLTSLRVSTAHHYSTGKSVTVAVVDSGVDGTHPDLTGHVLRGADLSLPGESSATGSGWNDEDGHGTVVASLIVGHGHGHNGADGILGIAPDAKILPVRDGVGNVVSSESEIRAINWAVNQHATVICLAEGGPDSSPQLLAAITDAERHDIVVVAAAGNTPDQGPQYPAAYPGVLAVAGTDEHGKHAAVSVTQHYISIAAPATNIYSDYLNHGYYNGTGTSEATAIVAGAAALVRSRFPHLSAAEVIHRLTATATDEGPPGRDDEYGYGELNLVAALTATVPPLRPSPSRSTSTSIATPTSGPATSAPSRLAQAADAPGSTPYLPVAAGVIVLLLVVGAWLTLRRR